MRILWSMWLLVLWVSPGFAQVEPTTDDIRSWADHLFLKAYDEHRYSGAIVTVVKDGEILFNQGYGYADYSKQSVVSPTQTQFRIGSITKTFTATAIAQLMEQGLIGSLDDPANKYLKRDQLPAWNGDEITLRQLITHSAGFANRTFNLGTDIDHLLPLSSEIIHAQQTRVVRAPGGRSVYSNYSTALLATIVEDLTGIAIADYFEQHIFAPLGMSNTILNMSPGATQSLAKPWVFFPSGEAEEVPHWGIHPFFAAVGLINSTGGDMASYMIAHLKAGRDGISPLQISPEGFSRLHKRIQDNHSEVQGYGMIFMTDDWAGHMGFGHGGDYFGFHSMMWMFPESQLGIFFSLMAEAAAPSFEEQILGSPRMLPNKADPVLPPLTNVGVMIDFLEHFFGPDNPPQGEGRVDVDLLSGAYRHEYRAYDTLESFLDLVSGPGAVIEVSSQAADTLIINGKGPYRQVAPGVFWNSDFQAGQDGSFIDSSIWAFSRDEDEQTWFMMPRFGGIDPYVKVSTLNNPALYGQSIAYGFLVLLSGLLAVFWRTDTLTDRLAKYAAIVTPICVLMMVVFLLVGYADGDSTTAHLLLGKNTRFLLAALSANLVAIGAAVLLVTSVISWLRWSRIAGWPAIAKQLHLSVLAIAALALVSGLNFVNFIGLNLP